MQAAHAQAFCRIGAERLRRCFGGADSAPHEARKERVGTKVRIRRITIGDLDPRVQAPVHWRSHWMSGSGSTIRKTN